MFLATFPWLTPLALALRNMYQRIGRTFLTLTGIVLGVAVVLAIQITNDSTLASINQLFDRAAGKANLLVVPNTGSGDVLDPNLVPKIEQIEGVEFAAPSVQVHTILAADAGTWEINIDLTGVADTNSLDIHGVDFTKDTSIRLYELSAGTLPEDEHYQVAITNQYADEKELDIGDDLVFLVPNGIERLRITGLLSKQGVGLINDGAVAFAPLSVIQDLFNRGGELDEIAIKANRSYNASPGKLDTLKTSIQKRVSGEARVIYPAARGQTVAKMLSTYQKGLSLFSLIAIFVGAFLIYNTFSMTVVERTREIGMLRAIGMNQFQVIKMVLAEAVLLSIIGSSAGLGVGVLMARGLMILMGGMVSSSQNTFLVGWQGILQSIGVGVGVTLGAALLPAAQAARISPLAALRIRSRSGDKVKPITWITGLVLLFVGWAVIYKLEFREGLTFYLGSIAIILTMLGATLTVPLIISFMEHITRPIVTALYGKEGIIGASNIKRSVTRTTLTVASLMVSLAMIIGIGSLAYSFEKDMSNWIDTALGGDLYVRSPIALRESFAHQLENVPGVAAVTPAKYLTVRVAPESLPRNTDEDDTLIMIAIDPSTTRKVNDVQFAVGQGNPDDNWATFAHGDSVFISSVVADRFHLNKGDKFRILTHRGAHDFTVAGVIIDFTGQGYVINCTYNDMKRWFSTSGVDRFAIKVEPGYDVLTVADEIKTRYKSSKTISVQTSEVFKADIRGLMEQAFRLFDVLNTIGVIIGALGVINTLTMNILERQREIGGLRSLGMTRSQIIRMVLAESLALGSIGCVYGLIFGYVMAQTLILGVNKMNSYDLTYTFTAKPFIIGIVLAILISQGAALLPARRAAQINIIEAIKHE